MNLKRMNWRCSLMLLGAIGIIATPGALAKRVNPPGPAGGVGHGPYWHHNPAGPRGGAGRGWTYNPPGPGRVSYKAPRRANPPGPVGGPGHGAYWHYNPAGPAGGAGRGWIYNPPGPGRTYIPRY